ncbi:uncharacterized protein LOC115882039 isoform X1 [Sitophilus oryzae]|uniref:Uncharacterized protein LOC115882039 isoform X1 n=1 Tax=Sitophilus oryzae TaxID=7048 RepID=A0A6J2XYH7_SITOR|nr:uncharacterized protein LOC115882039 isoform X1 [Sitophilus oryzae]
MPLDKAVSTEDLCIEDIPTAIGVLKLDAILNTLVENKVESIKHENGKKSSLQSSPKNLFNKLKCHASPKTTLKIEGEKKKGTKRKEKKDRSPKAVPGSKQFKRQVLRQETSSPDSQILHGEDASKYPGNSYQFKSTACMEAGCQSHTCYCNRDHIPVSMQLSDEYISIKMDGYGDIETDAIIAREEMRRARKKRRRRRKRRLKQRLALNPHLVDTLARDNESFKVLNDDELPPRAKWTIVATACLLMFMCLMLVGITLRMAPIIDELVREENEKLMNSLSNAGNTSAASVHRNRSLR